MANVVEKVCDYNTGKLNCQKRKGVQTIIVRQEVVDNDGRRQGPMSLFCVRKRDLCPSHQRMLDRSLFKIMGGPVREKQDQTGPAEE